LPSAFDERDGQLIDMQLDYLENHHEDEIIDSFFRSLELTFSYLNLLADGLVDFEETFSNVLQNDLHIL